MCGYSYQKDKLVRVLNEGGILEEGEDYTKDIRELEDDETEGKVYIQHKYMYQQEGTLKLTFEFESGTQKTIEIKIIPQNQEAELTNLEATYDWKKKKNNVQTRVKLYYNNELLSITNNDKKLVKGKDYDESIIHYPDIIFKDEFLKTLPEGENKVVFNFDNTEPIVFPINVVNHLIQM